MLAMLIAPGLVLSMAFLGEPLVCAHMCAPMCAHTVFSATSSSRRDVVWPPQARNDRLWMHTVYPVPLLVRLLREGEERSIQPTRRRPDDSVLITHVQIAPSSV